MATFLDKENAHISPEAQTRDGMTDKGTGQLILGVDQVILSIDQIESKSQTQFSLEDFFISSVLAELNPHLTDFKLPFALF